MNKYTRLVYSTDGSHKRICQVCKDDPCSCRKKENIDPVHIVVKIRLEKKARGGKSVTVLFNLPHNPDYFTSLAKKLKVHCGSGGTFKDDKIEIQGDHKAAVKAYLEKQGFQVKLSGG